MIEVPHVIKYMGSKRSILDFVTSAIKENYSEGKRLYDIFGGSGVVSGALRNEMPVTCNDMQSYTQVIAKLYLQDYTWSEVDDNVLDDVIKNASVKANKAFSNFDIKKLVYEGLENFTDVQSVELASQELITKDFKYKDHLFAKYYAGTYWSFEQCVWIDAISSVARSNRYKGTFLYPIIQSALMFSMSYCSQSTGHYAQHRVLTKENVKDVLMYRKKDLVKLFMQKFQSLKQFYSSEGRSTFKHCFCTGDYMDVLKASDPHSIVYADPPYQFVHYSRFYHALETLVKYDYPNVQHKGRYRDDRHQSPFCISTKVVNAFSEMFNVVNEKRSTLILSYSDNGMIDLESLLGIARAIFSRSYDISIRELAYTHSTMGRSGDKSRSVSEVLLMIKPV